MGLQTLVQGSNICLCVCLWSCWWNGSSNTSAYIQSTHSFNESKTVVLRLTTELNPKKYKIFFGKLFGSLELLIQLKSMDICVIDTLSQDVTRVCPLTTGSAVGKDGWCGTMSQLVERKAGLLFVLGPITEELYPYSIFLVKIQFLKQIALIVDTAR